MKKDQNQIFIKSVYRDVLTTSEFKKFQITTHANYPDSIEHTQVIWNFSKLDIASDSIIQNFKYSIRVGDTYIVRAKEYDRIGTKIPQQKVRSMDGNEIVVGGHQDKLTLINLWFIRCPGCIAEMPALKSLKERYSDKVNFVAITFEQEEDVRTFLKQQDFEFTHIINAESLIEQLATYPYPETIFLDKSGQITHIEGPLPKQMNMDVDKANDYF